jgi:hypothetical protein
MLSLTAARFFKFVNSGRTNILCHEFPIVLFLVALISDLIISVFSFLLDALCSLIWLLFFQDLELQTQMIDLRLFFFGGKGI